MTSGLPQKIIDQINKAGLPISGQCPFKPKLTRNQRGEQVIEKRAVATGPKMGQTGLRG